MSTKQKPKSKEKLFDIDAESRKHYPSTYGHEKKDSSSLPIFVTVKGSSGVGMFSVRFKAM